MKKKKLEELSNSTTMWNHRTISYMWIITTLFQVISLRAFIHLMWRTIPSLTQIKYWWRTKVIALTSFQTLITQILIYLWKSPRLFMRKKNLQFPLHMVFLTIKLYLLKLNRKNLLLRSIEWIHRVKLNKINKTS